MSTRKRNGPDAELRVKVNAELYAQLRAVCDERLVGMNLLVERLLVDGLDRLPPLPSSPD